MRKLDRPKEFFRRNFVTIRAVAVFVLSLALFFGMLNNDWIVQKFIDPLTIAVASVTAWIFMAGGQSASAFGQTVNVNDTTLSIAIGCNGTEAMALYLSTVLALPTRWKYRLIGIDPVRK